MGSLYVASVLLRRVPNFQKQAVIYPSPCKYVACYSTITPDSEEMEHIRRVLKDKFPLAKNIDVSDLSDGCGDMYEVSIESVEFKGLTTVKQHRLVNEALKDEIKTMHGIRIQTSIPPHQWK